MGILSDFEDRIGSAIEGVFAGAFRSPVQPVEIAKALARAADDDRAIGVGAVYAPEVYTVALSREDYQNLGSFRDTMAAELATYVADHAREQGYKLRNEPRVEFVVDDLLKMGRFQVSTSFGEEAATRKAATVTLGDLEHDVLLSGEEVVVGRSASCQICIPDANASRRHAAFVRLDDGWAIRDLGSTNGTRVNGALVKHARLRDGDVIDIGLTRLTYHEPKG